jgi:hypothetical protein
LELLVKIAKLGNSRWWVVVLVAVAACGSGANRAPTPDAGDDESPGAAGAIDPGDSTSGAGGTPGAAGTKPFAGDAAGGDFSDVVTVGGSPSDEPIDDACTGNRAFAASGSAFVKPTEQALALALDEDTYDTSPITFVLRGGDKPRVAASYTVDAGGVQAFPPELAPEETVGWIRKGGFGTDSAQVSGYLLVTAADGQVELPLENLTFTLTTQQHCTRGIARLSGTVPASRRDLVDKLAAAHSNNGNGNPNDPGRTPEIETPVHAVFAVELVDFDFGSTP